MEAGAGTAADGPALDVVGLPLEGASEAVDVKTGAALLVGDDELSPEGIAEVLDAAPLEDALALDDVGAAELETGASVELASADVAGALDDAATGEDTDVLGADGVEAPTELEADVGDEDGSLGDDVVLGSELLDAAGSGSVVELAEGTGAAVELAVGAGASLVGDAEVTEDDSEEDALGSGELEDDSEAAGEDSEELGLGSGVAAIRFERKTKP